MDKGGLLSLQAVANWIIEDYVTEGYQTAPKHTALRLVALSIKSLHNPRFAPTNTHALVKAWHYKIIDQLKEASRAGAGGSTAEVAHIQEEAHRLKQLSQALHAEASLELRHVQHKKAAQRFISWFRLGPQALAQWDELQRRLGRGRRASSRAASPPPSPCPSPSCRGKRKTPERPRAGPSRFAPLGAGPAGSPGAGGEPPRRRRTSSSEQEAEVVGSGASLQPRQLCFEGHRQRSSSSSSSSSVKQGPAVEGVAEWRAFKASLACPRQSAALAAAADAAASPATGAPPAVATLHRDCSPALAVVAPMEGVQQQLHAPCTQRKQAEQPGEGMDIDCQLVAALGAALEAPASLWTVGSASNASGCGVETALDGEQRAAGAGAAGLPLSPRQGATSACVTSPPFAPDCSAAWGLLQPSPSLAEKENGSCSAGSASAAETCAVWPTRTTLPPGSCQRRRHTQRRRQPAASVAAAVREAEAAQVLAEDVMLLMSEAKAGTDAPSASPQSTTSSLAVCRARQPAVQATSAAAQQQPGARQPMQVLRAHQGAASPCPLQPWGARRASPGSLPVVSLKCEDGRIVCCDRSVVRRAAAQKAAPAGGDLTPRCTFHNLNGRGRADSILRPVNLCV